MDVRRCGWWVRAGWLALAGGLVLACESCGPPAGVRDLPTPRATLTSAGRRLGGTLSAGELTAIARRGDRVLKSLTAPERDALARGYLRFRVDRDVVVTVAAPPGGEPFWLDDLGFAATHLRLEGPTGTWPVYRRRFGPGWVGLGVNALDRKATNHYVVFLQSPDCAPVVPSEIDGGAWRVLAAGSGVSLASGVDTPIRAIDPSLRGATLLQPAHDERHSTVLVNGRAWKTHSVASRAPDQVTVSFGPDASREIVWSWRTAPGVRASVVRYYPLPTGSNTPPATPVAPVTEAPGTGRPVEVPELLNDPVVVRHSARTSTLEPDTLYAYSVGDGTPAGMSPWAAVRTGPRAAEDTHLLYMGDPQCGLEGWGVLLAEARRRHPEAGALLIAGDLVDRGNERSNWDHFFLRAAGTFERLPVMPAVGNHEYLDKGPRLYRSFFNLPANGPEGVDPGLVYAFEYGDAFVAVLDSTRAETSPREAARQARWLDSQLSHTGARWTIVMFHHPLYASHTTREYPALRAAWLPVIDRHRVDLVLQGHDHAYLRTYPLRENRRAATAAEGTVYVVSVSGDKYCDQAPRDYTEVGLTRVSTYQTIDITGGGRRLDCRAWAAGGRLVDAFGIDKPDRASRLAGR